METEQGFRQRYALIERIGIGGKNILSSLPCTCSRMVDQEESV